MRLDATLDSGLAAHLARIPLGHVTREYPHKLDHVWASDADCSLTMAKHGKFNFVPIS